MVNELKVGDRRYGNIFDGDHDTPTLSVTLERTDTGVYFSMTFDQEETPQYLRWFTTEFFAADVPEDQQAKKPAAPPSELVFRDTHGSIVLLGCTVAGYNTNYEYGYGSVRATAAVVGAPTIDYARVTGFQSEVSGLRAWVGASSISRTTVRIPETGRLKQTYVLESPDSIPIPDSGLSFKPTFTSSRDTDSVKIRDVLLLEHKSEHDLPWHIHQSSQLAVRDLLAISRWRAETVIPAFVCRPVETIEKAEEQATEETAEKATAETEQTEENASAETTDDVPSPATEEQATEETAEQATAETEQAEEHALTGTADDAASTATEDAGQTIQQMIEQFSATVAERPVWLKAIHSNAPTPLKESDRIEHLIRWSEVGPEGITKWIKLREDFARAVDPAVSSIYLENPIIEVRLTQIAIGLEALGFLIAMRDDGKTEGQANNLNFKQRLDRIAQDIPGILPFVNDAWSQTMANSYNSVKHVNRPSLQMPIVANSWREGTLLFRAWFASELGVDHNTIKTRLRHDRHSYPLVEASRV